MLTFILNIILYHMRTNWGWRGFFPLLYWMNLHQPIRKKVAPGTSLLHLLFTCCHHVRARPWGKSITSFLSILLSLCLTPTPMQTHTQWHTRPLRPPQCCRTAPAVEISKKRKSDLGFRFKHLNWIKVRDTLNPEKHTHPDSHRVTPLRSLHRRKSLSTKSVNFNISCKIVSPLPHALIPKPARVVRLVNPEEKLRLQT